MVELDPERGGERGEPAEEEAARHLDLAGHRPRVLAKLVEALLRPLAGVRLAVRRLYPQPGIEKDTHAKSLPRELRYTQTNECACYHDFERE